MAAIAPTRADFYKFRTFTWSGVTAADTCNALELGGATDRSVQFTGTWDSATFVLKGSNDGTTYIALTDPQGNAVSKTADAIEQLEEGTRYVQPTHSGGGGSQSVTITLFVVRK